MIKILILPLLLIGQIEFNNLHTNPCSETYVSAKFGISIRHSKNWSAYEFGGNRIGLEYKGLDNFDRRYDVQIVFTLSNSLNDEITYYSIPDTLQVLKEKFAQSKGIDVKFSTKRVESKKFANREWQTFKMTESGILEGKNYEINETAYFWYSTDKQVCMSVRVAGKNVKNLDVELNCILNGLTIE